MAKLGATYRCNLPPRHIWVIISDPAEHAQSFLFVNLTTFTEGCIDDCCILQSDDYPPYLTHATTVAYSRFHIGSVRGIEALVAAGQFHQMPDLPRRTLNKMIDGAHSSRELPKMAKAMLPPRQENSTA